MKSRDRGEVIIGHWEKSLLPYFFILVLMDFLSELGESVILFGDGNAYLY